LANLLFWGITGVARESHDLAQIGYVAANAMTAVKGLVLGSAAALVAAGGAQAADPQQPVQYVKVCSLHGDGYYTLPGSDTCIRLGGHIHADYGDYVAGRRTPAYSGTQSAQDRTVSPRSTQQRSYVQPDTRTQTPYGTLTSLPFESGGQSESFDATRALIRWAGFTFGRVQSFHDTFNFDLHQRQNNSDTFFAGVNTIAYTFDLGNGASIALGADERRTTSPTNLWSAAAVKSAAEATTSFQGERWPDAHVEFKLDQAWGYFAASFVAHDVSATYYSGNGPGAFAGFAGCVQPNTTQCGHATGKVGWAMQVGGELNLPMFGPAD
jgi:hypothetical protein